MQEDWSLIRSMIEEARKVTGARITAKIRIMDNEEITLRYAKMIERSCSNEHKIYQTRLISRNNNLFHI